MLSRTRLITMGQPTKTKTSGNPAKQGFCWKRLTSKSYRADLAVQSRRHTELVSSISAQVAEGFKQWEAHTSNHMKSSPVMSMAYSTIDYIGSAERKLPSIYDELESYSVRTLELISQHVTTDIDVYKFLKSAIGDPETKVREEAVFPNGSYRTAIRAVLRQVSGTDDLSTLAGNSYWVTRVNAVISLISKNDDSLDEVRRSKHEKVTENMDDNARKLYSNLHGRIALSDIDKKKKFIISPELAEVAMDHHDRLDDIIDYTRNRDEKLEAVDPGHLREYLALPTTVFGDGVL